MSFASCATRSILCGICWGAEFDRRSPAQTDETDSAEAEFAVALDDHAGEALLDLSAQRGAGEGGETARPVYLGGVEVEPPEVVEAGGPEQIASVMFHGGTPA